MAQKRKLNRGLEALLGSGLLAKGQEEVARAGEPPTAAEPSACLLYTSPSPRDATLSRMPSSA